MPHLVRVCRHCCLSVFHLKSSNRSSCLSQQFFLSRCIISTSTKLAALSARRDAFESEKKGLLEAVASESDEAVKIWKLLDGVLSHIARTSLADLPLNNVGLFLGQHQHDPSFSL